MARGLDISLHFSVYDQNNKRHTRFNFLEGSESIKPIILIKVWRKTSSGFQRYFVTCVHIYTVKIFHAIQRWNHQSTTERLSFYL